MSDNTTVNAGVGGDIIRTDEAISYATGAAVSTKTQVMKLATGRAGVDGGLVSTTNPLPVADAGTLRELENMNARLDVLIELLRNGG